MTNFYKIWLERNAIQDQAMVMLAALSFVILAGWVIIGVIPNHDYDVAGLHISLIEITRFIYCLAWVLLLGVMFR